MAMASHPPQSSIASGRVNALVAVAASLVFVGGFALLHSASAWSILHANPTINKNINHNRHSRLINTITHHHVLHAMPGENDNDNDEINDDDDGSSESRRRKRDILKRTLGLGGSSAATSGGSEPVKLNTDNLFKGMPGMDSIVGSTTPSIPFSDAVLPETPLSGSNDDDTSFQKQGQVKKDPDLLTPDDIAALDSKYDDIKYQSEQLVSDELSKGSSGEFGKKDGVGGVGDYVSTDTTINETMNITQEEARKIVDYAVQEEKLTEKQQWNERKKQDLITGWEMDGKAQEDLIDSNLSSSPDGGEAILQNDGVAREIIENAAQRETQDTESQEKKRELEFYQRQMMQRQEIEGIVEKAAQDMGGKDADIDNVYEEAITQIQSSRKSKLGAQTLGVYANSIALEQGREYVRSQKETKDFLLDVEREADLVGKSDEEVGMFFKAPVNYEEERMYRSIVRGIVDKRSLEEEEKKKLEQSEMVAESEEEEEEAVGYALPSQRQDDVKAKYKLSAKETVEAYKLLNLWREMQSQQDAMERARGMKDDDNGAGVGSDNTITTTGSRGGGRVAGRPLNKLEPFFLYEEDSEEKRQKERDNLIKVLKKGLESDDDVENSSNELLMKELFDNVGGGGGGITKERSIRLLDKLIKKSKSGSTIRSSLEELKVTILEEDDAVDMGEGEEGQSTWLFRKRKSDGPIDLTGVFRTSGMEEEVKASSLPSKPVESTVSAESRTMPSWVGDEKKEETLPPPPPNTAFFSSSTTEEESASDIKAPPPPNTPFFQSEVEEGSSQENKSTTGGMFGTYEEQKLQRLANTVGAQTEEEMEELRRNMEALKEAEEMANLQLSEDDFDIEAASAKLGIDMGSLNLDDDNDDQIMSVIGKRPVASSPPTGTTQSMKVVMEFNEYDESDDIIVDAGGHLKKMKDTTTEGGDSTRDIADDIFRAKTAGRYHDAATRDSDEAAYRAFIQMEADAEKKFDSISQDTLSSPGEDIDDIDVDAYAEDIMSEMKPRPQVRGRKEDFMSREEIQRERKKESIFGDDDPFPVNDDDDSVQQQQASASSSRGGMPEWFRKEQEALGIKVEDLDDDDFDEARREWEREERQRKADEYLKKRGEGISISDVLGREYFGPMDEPDDNYETSPSFDSFEARKELLLGYAELTVEDINNVVDYKVDPLATGYNRYLSRVQRPFSEFGAIFRLEGVLVDMIGMQAAAWKTVAERYGYKIQSSDEVRQASLYKPEDALREVFYWTDDIFELKDIAEAHHASFEEAFNKWVESGGNVASSSEDYQVGSADLDSSIAGSELPKSMPSDEEMNSMYYLAWSKLANDLDKVAPTNDQVYRGIMGADWEVAVKDIFGWSEDSTEVYEIVVAYDEILQKDYKVLLQKYGIDLDKMNAEQDESQFGLNFPDLSSKEGVKEWLDTLREVEMPCAIVSHLDSSQLDAVLNASGLAEYFPTDKRVSSDSNYSSERSELLGAALRVDQRPDKCVIFDNTPHSANEAHEVCMKSVSLVDHYARYELLTADLSVGYARDLDLISFTKLFDERTDLEPVLELDVISGLQKQQRKVKTAFWDE